MTTGTGIAIAAVCATIAFLAIYNPQALALIPLVVIVLTYAFQGRTETGP